jgi:molybdenum-dependent DNA-binding transcriptional regulator ModE
MLNTNERIIKHKVGLLNLAEELGNVSKACQVMGLSRDTFYRYKSAVEEGGVDALLEADRRKPNPKNRVEPKVEAAVTQYAIDFPAQALRYWFCTATKRASKAPSSANNSRY